MSRNTERFETTVLSPRYIACFLGRTAEHIGNYRVYKKLGEDEIKHPIWRVCLECPVELDLRRLLEVTICPSFREVSVEQIILQKGQDILSHGAIRNGVANINSIETVEFFKAEDGRPETISRLVTFRNKSGMTLGISRGATISQHDSPVNSKIRELTSQGFQIGSEF